MEPDFEPVTFALTLTIKVHDEHQAAQVATALRRAIRQANECLQDITGYQAHAIVEAT